MEETFRRATRMRVLPRVAKMERKMFRAIKNIHTALGGIAIGVESHRLGLMQKKRRFQFGFFSYKATKDELSRTNELLNEITNLFLMGLDRNWQVKLNDT